MATYAAETEVLRPADEVFAVVLDIARWGEWTDMQDIRQDGTGQPAVGSTGTFSLPGPFHGPVTFELTALEPNRRVEYRMRHPSFEWRAEMSVQPRPAGARLATSGEFRMRGWRRVLEPIVGRELRKVEAGELQRLKALLEGSPMAASFAAEA